MNDRPTVSKFSVSIPAELSHFLEQYQKDHDISRSEAVTRGLENLREQELTRAYKEHAKEWQTHPDKEFWDTAALDDDLDDMSKP